MHTIILLTVQNQRNLDEMVLETQADILRLETRRREGKEKVDMEIQKDIKRDIHQAHAGNDEETNPLGRKSNNQQPNLQ